MIYYYIQEYTWITNGLIDNPNINIVCCSSFITLSQSIHCSSLCPGMSSSVIKYVNFLSSYVVLFSVIQNRATWFRRIINLHYYYFYYYKDGIPLLILKSVLSFKKCLDRYGFVMLTERVGRRMLIYP